MFCFLSFVCTPGIKGNITNITSLSLIWNLGNYTKELPGQKLYVFDRFQTSNDNRKWNQQTLNHQNTWFSNGSKKLWDENSFKFYLQYFAKWIKIINPNSLIMFLIIYREMWALEYEVDELQHKFADSIGKMDLDNLDVDFIEDMMLKAKPLQTVLNCIRNRQIVSSNNKNFSKILLLTLIGLNHNFFP